MKKLVCLLFIISTMLLIGCASTPKTYGIITDWSSVDTGEYHVKYAVGKDGCYSDGSSDSNAQFNYWVESYTNEHN